MCWSLLAYRPIDDIGSSRERSSPAPLRSARTTDNGRVAGVPSGLVDEVQYDPPQVGTGLGSTADREFGPADELVGTTGAITV